MAEAPSIQLSEAAVVQINIESAAAFVEKAEDATHDEEIKELTASLFDTEPLRPSKWPELCIYRVPKELRVFRDKEIKQYTPKLISIGPFHHGNQELQDMENMKLIYFKEFCYRTRNAEHNLVKFAADKRCEVERSYSEMFHIAHDKFLRIILLDAVFIVELFLRFSNSQTHAHGNDLILSKPWMIHAIRLDFLLLENQLPYSFLDEFFQFLGDDCSPTFLELACNFFCLKFKGEISKELKEVKHFTDLLRTFHILPILKAVSIDCSERPSTGRERTKAMHSTKKLDESGVNFKATVAKEVGLLGIEFQKMKGLEHCPCINFSWLLNCLPWFKCLPILERTQPRLKIPQLEITTGTELFFRNLIALELCHYPSESYYFCNYICLLDFLINTERDVELLVDKSVIINRLGSNAAVLTLIKELGSQIVPIPASSCFKDSIRRMNQHCKNPWNRVVATMSSVYFPDIWRGTATVLGLIILGFTLWNFIRPFVLMRH
ncbi:UPF0481 protein At3g47200-like [Juglans microcarpa x Juglans regia]|uniref:UPF0481 protein At3g47200-like n=1 Tax=Juglans microcarpa x Juglans regia TaxID=2249226 RepID=UPI001B7E5725|nr:UPF0481 protein At3g47200-like [Juglans microcarpa x Juglans regia]XP_040995392.1 UPF0481 protein At3g47200-like [Juglans microcarpa x Juglans regia]